MSNPDAIWVYVSHHDGRADSVGFELLGKAFELAEQANMRVEAVLVGARLDRVTPSLLHAGASTVRVADDAALASFSTVAYARVLAALASRGWAGCNDGERRRGRVAGTLAGRRGVRDILALHGGTSICSLGRGRETGFGSHV